jgi:hypothetical protein
MYVWVCCHIRHFSGVHNGVALAATRGDADHRAGSRTFFYLDILFLSLQCAEKDRGARLVLHCGGQRARPFDPAEERRLSPGVLLRHTPMRALARGTICLLLPVLRSGKKAWRVAWTKALPESAVRFGHNAWVYTCLAADRFANRAAFEGLLQHGTILNFPPRHRRELLSFLCLLTMMQMRGHTLTD